MKKKTLTKKDFFEITQTSAEKFGALHLQAYLRLSHDLLTVGEMSLHELSDREKTLVTLAIYSALKAAKQWWSIE